MRLKASTPCWGRGVACGRTPLVVRRFIRRWPIFVRIATGCVRVSYGLSISPSALG